MMEVREKVSRGDIYIYIYLLCTGCEDFRV